MEHTHTILHSTIYKTKILIYCLLKKVYYFFQLNFSFFIIRIFFIHTIHQQFLLEAYTNSNQIKIYHNYKPFIYFTSIIIFIPDSVLHCKLYMYFTMYLKV